MTRWPAVACRSEPFRPMSRKVSQLPGNCCHGRSAPSRRSLRHLPGRPDPAVDRLRGRKAARRRRLHGRGSAPGLLRAARLQLGRPRDRARHRRAGDRRVRVVRLRRRALRLVRRHAQGALSRAVPRRSQLAAARRCVRGQDLRAHLVPGRRARRHPGRRRPGGDRDLSRRLLRPARAQRARPAAPAAWHRARAHARGDARLGRVLRVRRHLLRQVSRHLQRDRREEGGERGGDRRRPAARRRSRLPDEHRRQAAARGQNDRGAPCRRGAGRHDHGACDRRAGASASGAAAMTHVATSPRFKENAKAALADPELQNALKFVEVNFIARRREVADRLPEFDALRDSARDIKNHTLAHLDLYLEAYEAKVTAAGGHVHYAVTAEDAKGIVLDICRRLGARTVTKGKSMIGEEIAINDHLEANGITPVETDLGEYIIQLRHEIPSHIIAPAVHLTKAQIEADFRRAHDKLPADRNLGEPTSLLAEARAVLREKFLAADVGITGANFLVAETGTSIIVTNEGNGDLTQTLPKAHIVLASIEKLVPTLEDVSQMLRVLARSATGQEMSVYTTLSTGPRRADDPDGPGEYHVVILDNGRSSMLGGDFGDMLRCIRCGACMNHCPVYHAVGGHAYGWVYPGPMGAVLTPSLIGVDQAGHLPNASTFCGRCEEICPVRIPLPRMMRSWREREFERHLSPATARAGLGLWAFFARRPRFYGLATSLAMRLLALAGRRKGRFQWLPFASGWTRHRDFPAPTGATFQARWHARKDAR